MRVENSQGVEALAGIVRTDDAGRLSQDELERLTAAMQANLKLAELHESFRSDHLEAERRVVANIRDQRIRAGLSQEQVASALRSTGWDLHQSTIAKIEAGKRPLRLAEVYAFADVLSVPWVSLIEGGRDIDILPSDGMLPVDLWQANLEETLLEREAVMEELVADIEAKARRYAEYDRQILVRIAALSNAAAQAVRLGQDVDTESINGLVDRWLQQASEARAQRDRYESEEYQEEIARLIADRETESAQQKLLLKEFLEWRSSTKKDS